MNKLNFIKSMGFKISWKLINLGLFGDDYISAQLTHNDVLEYLDSLLMHINEQTDSIVTLVCKKDDVIEFDRFLKNLASEDDSDIYIQRRKWKAFMLKMLINNTSEDCLQGLLELMEFWLSMYNTNDCPINFPIRDNKKSVQEFFTLESYNLCVEKSNEWLHEEISIIVKLEAQTSNLN